MDRIQKEGLVRIGWLVIAIAIGVYQVGTASGEATDAPNRSTTVLFYMNGDNDLTDEVLSAVDAIETVGSSTTLQIIALVDGHPIGSQRFGKKWAGTYLLHVTPDRHNGHINSTILADWGELDLGNPETLTKFVRVAIENFPAERYIFCAFAHGKGVIDTGNLTGSSNAKSLSISTDATSQTIMPLDEFAHALEAGLNDRRFSLMVLFSCLSSMVEIGYAVSNVTDYLIASEDEIRLVNDPPGSHQLRGILFDEMLQQLKAHPYATDVELGKSLVDRFIEPYTQTVCTIGPGGRRHFNRYPASLAVVDCRSIDQLAASLDTLAAQLITDLNQDETAVPTLASLHNALSRSQTFKSFLNLQYYDLQNWLNEVALSSHSGLIREMCRHSADLLASSVIQYERHTDDVGSNGMAVFFDHPLVPDNISSAHLAMYRRTRFSRNTRWDELIDTYRRRMQSHRADLLLYQCRQAYDQNDRQRFERLLQETMRFLASQIRTDNGEIDRRFRQLLTALPAEALSPRLMHDLQRWRDQEIHDSQLPVVVDQPKRQSAHDGLIR